MRQNTPDTMQYSPREWPEVDLEFLARLSLLWIGGTSKSMSMAFGTS